MARKRRVRIVRQRKSGLSEQTRRQISGIVQLCAGVLLFLVLQNQAGIAGASVQKLLAFFFGRYGMVFPILLIISGGLSAFGKERKIELKRSIGLVVCLLSFLGLMHMRAPIEEIGPRREELAGAIGFMMSFPFLFFLSRAVGYTVLATSFLVGIFLAFEPDMSLILKHIKSVKAPAAVKERKSRATIDPDFGESVTATEDEEEEEEEVIEEEEEDDEESELNIVRPAFGQKFVEEEDDAPKSVIRKNPDELEMKDTRFEEWTFPTLDLLEPGRSEIVVNDEELKMQAKRIEEKLQEFGVEVTVRDARPGPTVTQFTLEPSEGVKLSRIGNLKDDLALALAAPSLRIEAPIPGKSLVGIEMPNTVRTTVHIRELLESPAFQQSSSSLTLPLGRDASGDAIIANLETMPHLLIAGATGSGKSVCMNTFLIALLFQNAPDQLKFILIDPKRVELTPYDGIPHLLTPVITEAEKALQALRWAVAEMGRRLKKFSEEKVRNLDEFNEKQTDETKLLPRIVVVIDELADLMMRLYRRDTEMMITRIAQMARAAGLHLIVATQRPSVDVITGLIKANIPTRIAFRTVSSIDSRTILDSIGSEDLLGQGDMLYSTATTPKPIRIQGIYVSTKEVERVINNIKLAGGGKLTEEIGLGAESGTDEQQNNESDQNAPVQINLDADDDGGDNLFFDAVQIVQESGKASASLLQRQLKVGYARAARLLDIMEKKGLIGPADGAKARKIYMQAESGADHRMAA